jgi:hypothetical protein
MICEDPIEVLLPVGFFLQANPQNWDCHASARKESRSGEAVH